MDGQGFFIQSRALFENDPMFFFGMDPVDFNHCKEHPYSHFVTLFTVYDSSNETKYVEVCCSWKHALLLKRFIMALGLMYYEEVIFIQCKLSRFNLDRYYEHFKKTFSLDEKFDSIKWSDLDESGIVKYRSKKRT